MAERGRREGPRRTRPPERLRGGRRKRSASRPTEGGIWMERRRTKRRFGIWLRPERWALVSFCRNRPTSARERKKDLKRGRPHLKFHRLFAFEAARKTWEASGGVGEVGRARRRRGRRVSSRSSDKHKRRMGVSPSKPEAFSLSLRGRESQYRSLGGREGLRGRGGGEGDGDGRPDDEAGLETHQNSPSCV